jgi:hypothetical protein
MQSSATDAERSAERRIEQLITNIADLPASWHLAGTVSVHVLRAIVRHMQGRRIRASAETGSGKTTLLLSHLSGRHTVFAKEGDNRSISVVRESPLLNAAGVEFVEGATQRTLPRHVFPERLQFALIDGPHGYPFPDLEYYFLYPHLEEGGLLLVDDVHIATIGRMVDILKEDAMFDLVEVVGTTAFLRRTAAPVFDPEGDGWWLQDYNTRRMPRAPLSKAIRSVLSRRAKQPFKRVVRRLSGR